jgi:hypothetical protein
MPNHGPLGYRSVSSLVGRQISPRVSGHTVPRFGFLPSLGGFARMHYCNNIVLSLTLIGKAGAQVSGTQIWIRRSPSARILSRRRCTRSVPGSRKVRGDMLCFRVSL